MANLPKSKRYNKDWRNKEANLASLKYTKQEILDKFMQFSHPPLIKIPDLLVTDFQLPILQKIESVACENSRKNTRMDKKEKKERKDKKEIKDNKETKEKKEINETKEKKEKKEKKNDFRIGIIQEHKDSDTELKLEEYQEQKNKISEIDTKIESSSSIENGIIIKYPLDLIISHVDEGNPFACIIIESEKKGSN